ncbi:MAG TPA: enolase C-terminal domain-like protein, partial [Chthonomonadales bacterium]|nr:enolase C-terminal domain-like protein [Chthonomonadales bacterium]
PPVDVALLDLCAKGAGCPLWALLGGRCRHEVPVYDSSVHFEDLVEPGAGVEAVAERARDAVQRGFGTVKVRVGRGYRWMPWPDSTDRDVEACRAVRKAVGPDVSIIVDASCGYAGYVEDAADFFAEVGDDGIGFATDMVALSEIGALRRALACRGIRLPLAAAPVLESPAVAEALLAHGTPDILETSPAQTGVVQWLQIARTAAARGAQVTCRSNGSHVGLHTGLHLATVAPHCAICEYPDVSYPDSLRSETVVHCGRVCAPSEPGLGIRAIDPRRG